MKYEKVPATNANENDIAAYCANNNIEISLGNAYDVTMRTFKLTPIVQLDQYGAPHNVTERVARYIECQPTTIARIAEKNELIKVELQQDAFRRNIEKAQVDAAPDLTKLVKNLYRLNIVDENSYLALVCFLMQLKYSRDNEIPTNDKTCVFFNGVARNGKSATAKAICDIESQYGNVFKAQSGKLLESTHEEQVWKSHLNYFDEVKPTDIDRELLLTIVNGGEVELNPKNKKPYNHHVNTNNIFTSNDQISLKQRRVSIIKFGSVLFGTIKNLSNSALVLMCGIFTPAAIILQVSSTEPPPRAITHSAWHSCAALRPASISAMVGSELMSANRVQPTPALSSDCMMACS